MSDDLLIKPAVVKHAFNMQCKISAIEMAMFRAGPVSCIQDKVRAFIPGLEQLSGAEKFPEFVAAARIHGVKVIITLAVEEPGK